MKKVLFLFALALSLMGFNTASYAVPEQAAEAADKLVVAANDADKKKKKGEEDDEEPECE